MPVPVAPRENDFRSHQIADLPVHRSGNAFLIQSRHRLRLQTRVRVGERGIADERVRRQETVIVVHAVAEEVRIRSRGRSPRRTARRRRQRAVEHELIPGGGAAAERLRARAQQRIRACLGVIPLVVQGETEIQRVACHEAQLGPCAGDIGATERTQLTAGVRILHQLGQRTGQGREFAGEIDILLIAVLLARDTGYPHEHLVGDDREVIAGTHIDAVILADGRLGIAGVVAFRLLGDVTHRATDRAASVQSALRSAIDFHPLEVQQVELRGHRRREVNVIDINADAGLEREVEIVLADAANECGLGIAECRLRGPETGVRHGVSDIRRGDEAAQFDVVRRDGRDGYRGLLQTLLAVAGRDHHFLEGPGTGGVAVVGRRDLGNGARRQKSQCADRRRRQRAARVELEHRFPPGDPWLRTDESR